jgi:hypothetical protein
MFSPLWDEHHSRRICPGAAPSVTDQSQRVPLEPQSLPAIVLHLPSDAACPRMKSSVGVQKYIIRRVVICTHYQTLLHSSFIIGSTTLFEPWPLFLSFVILYTVGGTPWTRDQPVARPLTAHRTAHTVNKHTDIHSSSGIRTHNPSVRAGENRSCHRGGPQTLLRDQIKED